MRAIEKIKFPFFLRNKQRDKNKILQGSILAAQNPVIFCIFNSETHASLVRGMSNGKMYGNILMVSPRVSTVANAENMVQG